MPFHVTTCAPAATCVSTKVRTRAPRASKICTVTSADAGMLNTTRVVGLKGLGTNCTPSFVTTGASVVESGWSVVNERVSDQADVWLSPSVATRQ